MRAQTTQLNAQLTATIQMDGADLEHARTLLPALERKVGRILVNGWPTGVEGKRCTTTLLPKEASSCCGCLMQRA
jgi:hypothetical protein